mgnify:CR=1 FL=1
MSSLAELYQNVILEHNRSPRNYRVIADADRQAGWIRARMSQRGVPADRR